MSKIDKSWRLSDGDKYALDDRFVNGTSRLESRVDGGPLTHQYKMVAVARLALGAPDLLEALKVVAAIAKAEK